MNTIFLTLIIFLCSFCSINAQYKESDLQGKVWKAIDGYFAKPVADCYMTFSTGEVVVDANEKYSNNMIVKTICKMYLAQERTKVFDSSLVGKDSEGKYIIMSRDKNVKGKIHTETFSVEIISVDDSTLMLKYAADAHTAILKAQY